MVKWPDEILQLISCCMWLSLPRLGEEFQRLCVMKCSMSLYLLNSINLWMTVGD